MEIFRSQKTEQNFEVHITNKTICFLGTEVLRDQNRIIPKGCHDAEYDTPVVTRKVAYH